MKVLTITEAAEYLRVPRETLKTCGSRTRDC